MKKCINCIFYRKIGDFDSKDKEVGEFGNCFRFPPVMINDQDDIRDMPKIDNIDTTYQNYFAWANPVVSGRNWCGEFRQF